MDGWAERHQPVWYAATGTPVASPTLASASELSPDGKRLLVVSRAGDPGENQVSLARIYDVATGLPIGPPLQFGPAGVRAVSFAPDGMSLLLAGEGGIAQLWRAPPGPVLGSVEQIRLWCQVLTGMALNDRRRNPTP